MFKARFIRIVAAAIFGGTVSGSVAMASDVDRLLDLLVGKHVVTEREAVELRSVITQDQAGTSPVTIQPVALKLVTQQPAAPQATAAPAASKERPVTGSSAIRLSGYVQTRWTNAVETTNPLEIRRARLVLAGSLMPKLAYQFQSDLIRSPVLLDARLDYNLSPFARLTAGQFKVPFSQENVSSESGWIPIERSLVVNSLAPGRDNGSNGRDIGVMAEGDLLKAGTRPLLSYSLGGFQGAGVNRRDDNRSRDVAVRLIARPLPQLSLIGDYYDGAMGTDRAARDRAAVEIAYVQKNYSVLGEYIWGRDGAFHRRGGYGLVTYRFQPKWEALARFDRYEPNQQQRTDTYLGGLNWYLNQWIKWQANYGMINDNTRTDNTQTVLTQLQFQF